MLNRDSPLCNAQFSIVSYANWASWANASIPANYYDNVLAFRALYYASGIDDFIAASNTLAARYWVIVADYYDGYYIADGNYLGEPKNQSITGLILWSWDQSVDVMSGLKQLWKYWDYLSVGFPSGISWQTNVGDLRDDGYMMAGFGLCYLYSPDGPTRSTCLNDIDQSLNHIFIPGEVGNTWNVATVQPEGPRCSGCDAEGVIGNAAGTVYVTVTDGSTTITIHGSTWSQANFSETTPYDMPIWFCTNCWGHGQFGLNGTTLVKQISDLGGDSVAYVVTSATSTTATLATPYDSGACPTGCNKTAEIAATAGMGVLPYMHGMFVGSLATYVLQALVAAGSSYAADLAAVKRMVADGLVFLQSAFDPSGTGMYGAQNFQGCAAILNPNHCAAGNVPAGEAMRGYAAGYAINPTSPNKTAGDAVYNTFWAKSVGGWGTPVGLNGPCPSPLQCTSCATHCYLFAANDTDDSDSGGFMLSAGAIYNKWFGFYWGYGFGFQLAGGARRRGCRYVDQWELYRGGKGRNQLMETFPWQMVQNFGLNGLVAALVVWLFNKWAGPFLAALKDHTVATTQQASAIGALAETVKEGQSTGVEILIAVRVQSSKIDQLERAIAALDGG